MLKYDTIYWCIMCGRRMKKFFIFFLLFCLGFASNASAEYNTPYNPELIPTFEEKEKQVIDDPDTNIETVKNNLKINEEEFDKIVKQLKKRFNDFDWNNFDKLDSRAQRMVIRNYLAMLAFDEIKQNYIKDIYDRSPDGVEIEKDIYGTYYFNKSDTKYRKLHVSEEDIINKAKRRCKTCDKNGHFKQTDVKLFDEIIAQETANAPADIHCEKYCMIESNEFKYIADNLKRTFDEFQQANLEYQLEQQKSDSSREDVREKRQKLRQAEKEYKHWQKVNKNSGVRILWIEPYTETCDLISIGCWNVEQRPAKYTKNELLIEEYDQNNLISIRYDYDDVANNNHIQADADQECTCTSDVSDVKKLVDCNCSISFYKEIQDFTAVRNWENQDRIDIKNGKEQDKDEKGHWNHRWESNFNIPGGRVVGHTLDMSGQSDTYIQKNKK